MALCADAAIGNVQEKTMKHFCAPNAEVVCIRTVTDCHICGNMLLAVYIVKR